MDLYQVQQCSNELSRLNNKRITARVLCTVNLSWRDNVWGTLLTNVAITYYLSPVVCCIILVSHTRCMFWFYTSQLRGQASYYYSICVQQTPNCFGVWYCDPLTRRRTIQNSAAGLPLSFYCRTLVIGNGYILQYLTRVFENWRYMRSLFVWTSWIFEEKWEYK